MKDTKHKNIHSLALPKRATIHSLVSKAFNDGAITDREFPIYNAELGQCFKVKGMVRAKHNRKQASTFLMKKIKKPENYYLINKINHLLKLTRFEF